MLDKPKKLYSDVKGTASELRDNRDYDVLVSKVGEDDAKRLIQSKLQERGVTIEGWEIYRETRSVLHQNPLKIREEVRLADELASSIFGGLNT